MPLPEPKPGESEDTFVKRCMGNDVMKKEFPKNDQRAAVCYKQYEKNNEESKMDIIEKIDKYLNEAGKPKFPKLFGQSGFWGKSKQKGYGKADIPTKDGDGLLEVEGSPDEPEYIGWSEKRITKKGKANYGDSGQDDIEDFEKDGKGEVELHTGK